MKIHKKIILTLTFYFLIFIILFVIVKQFFFTIKMSGISMNPTYKEKDYLLTKKDISKIKRNDVIAYEPTKSNNAYIIKRVIGLPGDTIYLGENDSIYINGDLFEDKYGYFDNNEAFASGLSYTLEEDEYFVLGDNRHHSIDSRTVGLIKKDRIKGIVIKKLKFPMKN